MSKCRIMGAGNAGASKYLTLNGNNGGGSKKQGLPSNIGRKENDDRSYGNNRNVVFYMNQLGGVGKGKSMFSTNADGVHNPTKSLFKYSLNMLINIEGKFFDYFKTALNSEQINIMRYTLSNYHNVSQEQIIIKNIEIGSISVYYDIVYDSITEFQDTYNLTDEEMTTLLTTTAESLTTTPIAVKLGLAIPSIVFSTVANTVARLLATAANMYFNDSEFSSDEDYIYILIQLI